jgi:hypothetical protein
MCGDNGGGGVEWWWCLKRGQSADPTYVHVPMFVELAAPGVNKNFLGCMCDLSHVLL